MSVYLAKGKGWRYDFILKGTRHTEAWFKTKNDARKAEVEKRKELEKKPQLEGEQTRTDMAFLDLVNRRLDHVKAYNSEEHYRTYSYLAKRWVSQWSGFSCLEISQEMVQDHLLARRKISAYTANKDLRYLRATFSYGLRTNMIHFDPTKGLDFFPVEKKIKYIPTIEEIDRIIEAADPNTRDFLLTIRETMGRVGEITRLTWEDIDFEGKAVILYTRKKRGGHLTPRKIPMTQRLYETLRERYLNCDEGKPWVFWHRYWSNKDQEFKEGPYGDRKKIMRSLCKKAGVRYFRFHPLRHAGASIMDGNNVPIGAIQRILGHENRKTTEIYLHSIGEMEREAIGVYEKALKNSHTDSHIAAVSQKKED